MNNLVKRIPLAIVFAVFGFFTGRLNPEGLDVIDKAALFLFGSLAGINLGLYWAGRKDSVRKDVNVTIGKIALSRVAEPTAGHESSLY